MTAASVQTRSSLLAELVGDPERAGGGVVAYNHHVGLGRVT
jgi:hypothetical protein